MRAVAAVEAELLDADPKMLSLGKYSDTPDVCKGASMFSELAQSSPTSRVGENWAHVDGGVNTSLGDSSSMALTV